MSEKIRLGVIGCGQFMSRQHIQTIVRSENLSLYYLADQDRQRLEQVSLFYKPRKTTTRWQDIVEDQDVDILVAGIVPKFHPDIVKAALEKRKPVYIEKPLSENLVDGKVIQELSGQYDVPVAVGFNRRFAPATQHIKKAFQSAGRPITIFYRICDDDRIRPPSQNWKKQDRLLIEIVHIFDLLYYLIQAEPVSIYAVESRFNDALITIKFSDNSNATILSSSWGSLAQPKEHLEAVLDRANVEMDDFVEVRSYGNTSLSAKQCFQGRAYDRCDNSHVEAFAADGWAAMLKLRQFYYRAMRESGVLEDSSNTQSWEKANDLLGAPPVPQINYTSDKGWGIALEEFCERVIKKEEPANAGPVDGNRTIACAIAARSSIETGKPVVLRQSDWTVNLNKL